MQTGWIKIHRQMLEWRWYDDLPTKCLFLHLLLKANYEPKEWHGIQVERGQIITSYKNLANETGLTVPQVRLAVNKLCKTGEIASKTTNKFSVITICNFDTYQSENFEDNKQDSTQDSTQITNKKQTNSKQIATTKEIKKEKNERNEELLKEKNTKKESKKELDQKFKQSLLELGVSEPIADEWMSVRKGKRNSDIVIRHLIKAANEAGISVQEAVEFSAERQYIGFEASWYIKAQNEQRKTQGAGGGMRSREELEKIVEAGIQLHSIMGTNPR